MKTLEYSRSTRLIRVLVIAAIIVSLCYFGKLMFEALHTTHDAIEVVSTKTKVKSIKIKAMH